MFQTYNCIFTSIYSDLHLYIQYIYIYIYMKSSFVMRRQNTSTKSSQLFYTFCWEINTFIQQGCITLMRSDSKDIYNVRIVFNLLFILKKIKVSTKILSSTAILLTLIIINISWTANQHVSMISEGSWKMYE